MLTSSSNSPEPSKSIGQLVEEFNAIDQMARAIQAQMVNLAGQLAVRAREMTRSDPPSIDPLAD